MKWLDLAKKLPTGHSVRFRHCGKDSAGVAFNNEDGFSFYCHRCGEHDQQSVGYLNFKELLEIRKRNDEAKQTLRSSKLQLPFDFTLDIPPEGMIWLLKASITPYMAREAGFGWTPYFKRVLLPVYDDKNKLIYYQARAVLQGQDPKYLNPKVDRASLLYWNRHSTSTERVVVTEDILSARRVFLAQSRVDTVSILGTKLTIQQANQLANYDQVTMWLDPDKAGRNGDIKIRRLLNLATDTDYISLDKDPKLLTDMQIRDQICN